MSKPENVTARGTVMRNLVVAAIVLLAAVLVTAVVARSERSREVTDVVNADRTAPLVTKASTERTREVAVIGDSYTSGTSVGGQGDRSWARTVEKLIQRRIPNTKFKIAAIGGSGYVAQGSVQLTFRDQVRRVVNRNTDVVVLFGSRNDLIAENDQLQAAVTATLATVQSLSPSAKIIVIGPAWVNEYPPGGLLAQLRVIELVANKFDVEALDPVAARWFTTTTPDLIGSDNVHPNDAGHRMMAQKIYPLILSAVDATAGMRG